MRKTSILWLGLLLLAPAISRAANAAAQDFDEQGLALYRQGMYAKSITYFQSAVQADPNDWQGYENLGNAYVKINDNQDALAAYQKSLDINPDNNTLNSIVQNLQSTTAAQGNNGGGPNNPPQASGSPDQQNITVQTYPRRPWRRREVQPEPVYKDGLAPINHARGWLDVDLAYNWANQADLFTSANNLNAEIQKYGYTGIATADHGGIEGGAELGFLLNPYNGLAIGIRGIQSNNYNSNLSLNNGNPSDFETISLTPYVVPLTLDYYLFLPDHDGRFFLSAGVGYYFVDVHGDDSFSYTNEYPTSSPDEYLGDMYGGNVGFQVGIGREFEISRHFGLRLFARGRYAKITNINGTFTSQAGVSDNYGLVAFSDGTVGVDSTSHIGGGEHYATLDYTGFEFGVGLTFF